MDVSHPSPAKTRRSTYLHPFWQDGDTIDQDDFFVS